MRIVDEMREKRMTEKKAMKYMKEQLRVVWTKEFVEASTWDDSKDRTTYLKDAGLILREIEETDDFQSIKELYYDAFIDGQRQYDAFEWLLNMFVAT